jgi:hypothetical protein
MPIHTGKPGSATQVMLDGEYDFRNTLKTKTVFEESFCHSITCVALPLGDLLLRGLYAFYTEHERCGEWEGGVEGEWVFNLLALHLD